MYPPLHVHDMSLPHFVQNPYPSKTAATDWSIPQLAL